MRIQRKLLRHALAGGLALSLAAGAASAASPHALTGGLRYHSDLSQFEVLPYSDGDLSYALSYEYAEGVALWQLGGDFGPDVSGHVLTLTTTTNTDATVTNVMTATGVDFVFTPHANLLFQDRYFIGGGGIRTSYIRDVTGEGEWLDLYWQLQLGVRLPLARALALEGSAYYVFERWSKVDAFRFGDLEYGVALNYKF